MSSTRLAGLFGAARARGSTDFHVDNSSDGEQDFYSLDFTQTNDGPSPQPAFPTTNRMDSPPPQPNSTTESNDSENYFIDLMNKLQKSLSEIGEKLDITLPQIAVVGAQSSGKSSVLESFVGRDFLPRGVGLVTRTPIVVQLTPHPTEEYGMFLHKKDKKFTDFDEIRQEIEQFTLNECDSKQFSNKPITLEIFSPNVLKLTVIDTPGLFKYTSPGQPASSIKQVEDMVLEYIRPENVIILAVTPATADAGTSDALAFAKKVDPDGLRTIGVLTKIDRMEEGTNACQILENREFPLKKSWVGVVNRNPQEIEEKRDRQYILKKEQDVFSKPVYSHLKNRMGTLYLQKYLQQILRVHIKDNLASVRSKLHEKMKGLEKELEDLTIAMGDGPSCKEYYLTKLIQTFKSDLEVNLMGYSENVPMHRFTGGAIINFKLHEEVKNKLTSLSLVPNDQQLRTLIVNLNGIRNSVSVNGLAVDATCKDLLQCYKVPIAECVKCIQNILLYTVNTSAQLLDGYPLLKSDVLYLVKDWIFEAARATNQRLSEKIDSEKFYYNYCHPDFNVKALEPMAPNIGPFSVWSETVVTSTTPTNGTASGLTESDTNSESSASNVNNDSSTNNKNNGASTSNMNNGASTSNMNNGTSTNNVENDGSSNFELNMENEMNKMHQSLASCLHVEKQVVYVKGVVLNYFKIISKQIYDMVMKDIAYFLCKQFLDRVLDTLVPTIIQPERMKKLGENLNDDYRRAGELKMTIDSMKKALQNIEGF